MCGGNSQDARKMMSPLCAVVTLLTFAACVADYDYKVGFLAAGDDIATGPYNYSGALALCSANPLCMGFTFSLGTQNSTTPSDPVNVYFKSAQNYVCCDPTWATYLKTAPPQWPSLNFSVVSMVPCIISHQSVDCVVCKSSAIFVLAVLVLPCCCYRFAGWPRDWTSV
jgi:hypothetical protein